MAVCYSFCTFKPSCIDSSLSKTATTFTDWETQPEPPIENHDMHCKLYRGHSVTHRVSNPTDWETQPAPQIENYDMLCKLYRGHSVSHRVSNPADWETQSAPQSSQSHIRLPSGIEKMGKRQSRCAKSKIKKQKITQEKSNNQT